MLNFLLSLTGGEGREGGVKPLRKRSEIICFCLIVKCKERRQRSGVTSVNQSPQQPAVSPSTRQHISRLEKFALTNEGNSCGVPDFNYQARQPRLRRIKCTHLHLRRSAAAPKLS